jgi:hypothetical protein
MQFVFIDARRDYASAVSTTNATIITMPRPLHLNLFVHRRGHHEAGWRHPGATREALTDIDYFRDLAVKAEQNRFDSIFFADALADAQRLNFSSAGSISGPAGLVMKIMSEYRAAKSMPASGPVALMSNGRP